MSNKGLANQDFSTDKRWIMEKITKILDSIAIRTVILVAVLFALNIELIKIITCAVVWSTFWWIHGHVRVRLAHNFRKKLQNFMKES